MPTSSRAQPRPVDDNTKKFDNTFVYKCLQRSVSTPTCRLSCHRSIKAVAFWDLMTCQQSLMNRSLKSVFGEGDRREAELCLYIGLSVLEKTIQMVVTLLLRRFGFECRFGLGLQIRIVGVDLVETIDKRSILVLIIQPIDRACSRLSKTPLVVLIRPLQAKIRTIG